MEASTFALDQVIMHGLRWVFYFMDVLFPRISLELIITIQLTIQPNVLTWAPLQSQVQYVKCVGAQTQSYLPSYWPRIRMIKNLGAHFR